MFLSKSVQLFALLQRISTARETVQPPLQIACVSHLMFYLKFKNIAIILLVTGPLKHSDDLGFEEERRMYIHQEIRLRIQKDI